MSFNDFSTFDEFTTADGQAIGHAPAPIAVVSDNGPCFRGAVFKSAFADADPLLKHVRTRVRSPQTNGAAVPIVRLALHGR
jgi:hypothetical protein